MEVIVLASTMEKGMVLLSAASRMAVAAGAMVPHLSDRLRLVPRIPAAHDRVHSVPLVLPLMAQSLGRRVQIHLAPPGLLLTTTGMPRAAPCKQAHGATLVQLLSLISIGMEEVS